MKVNDKYNFSSAELNQILSQTKFPANCSAMVQIEEDDLKVTLIRSSKTSSVTIEDYSADGQVLFLGQETVLAIRSYGNLEEVRFGLDLSEDGRLLDISVNGVSCQMNGEN